MSNTRKLKSAPSAADSRPVLHPVLGTMAFFRSPDPAAPGVHVTSERGVRALCGAQPGEQVGPSAARAGGLGELCPDCRRKLEEIKGFNARRQGADAGSFTVERVTVGEIAGGTGLSDAEARVITCSSPIQTPIPAMTRVTRTCV